MNPNTQTRWWKKDWFLGLLLVLVTLLVYQPAWRGEAVYDDDDHLTPPELQSVAGLVRIWTELGALSQYYPVTHSAFWLLHQLWGDAMLGYHLVNILLHAGCALLLVQILKRLEIPGAWLAAMFFALHPVHVESVAWISEIKNTLSGMFYLGAALAYLHYDRERQRNFYAIALGLFVLAVLSKGVVASLPAALLVVFWWKRGRLDWRQDVRPLLPFFAIATVSGLLTAWVERKYIGATGEAFQMTLLERGLIAGRVVWFYFSKLLAPVDLIFIYPRWQISSAVWWQYIFPASALLLVGGLWGLRKHWRGPLAAILFFGGTLFPVMGFLNVYPFRYSFVADHYQYLASLGIIVAVATGAAMLWQRWVAGNLPLGLGATLALAITLGILSSQQSRMYSNAETLWQTTIARNPACAVAHSNLGNLALERGQLEEAIRHCRKSLELDPTLAETHNNLGNALRRIGRDDEALRQYQEALKLRPKFAATHFNVGIIFQQRNQTDEAQKHFEQAVAARPDFVKALNSLGGILLQKGQVDEALRLIRKAVQIRPDEMEAQNNLGNALLQQGRLDEAIAQYKLALKLRPDYALTHHNLAAVFMQIGQVDEAVTHFKKVLELQPENPNAHNNYGWGLLQKGALPEAASHLQKALQLRPGYVEAHINLAKTLLRQGRVRETLTQCQAALNIQPDNPHAIATRAWVLATWPDSSVRNAVEALALAQRANELSKGQNPLVLRALAAAYAESGQFAEAIRAAEQAAQRADAGNRALVGMVRADLAFYQAGQPMRETISTPAKSAQ